MWNDRETNQPTVTVNMCQTCLWCEAVWRQTNRNPQYYSSVVQCMNCDVIQELTINDLDISMEQQT